MDLVEAVTRCNSGLNPKPLSDLLYFMDRRATAQPITHDRQASLLCGYAQPLLIVLDVLIYAAADAQTQPIFPILRAASFVHGTPRTRQGAPPRVSTGCQCARPPCAHLGARR